MCIKEYKNILVEKPFAMSKAEVDSIFFEAKNRNVFVAEAMWTSYTPLHKKVLEWLDEGKIGAVKYGDAGKTLSKNDVNKVVSAIEADTGAKVTVIAGMPAMYSEEALETFVNTASGITYDGAAVIYVGTTITFDITWKVPVYEDGEATGEFVTTATTDEEAKELLTLMGAPFAK
jgi:hypothetical protein